MTGSIPKKRLSKYRNYLSQIPSFDRSTEECLKKALQDSSEILPEDEAFIHVFAPVICSFVYYVLSDAKRCGIKRLVFLARDGYLPYKAALELRPVVCPDIEISIISVSRFALRAAEYGLVGEECLDTICLGSLHPTFEKMMKKASLSDEEIALISDKIGMVGRTGDKLTHKEISEIKEKLRNVPEFFEAVGTHAADNLKIVTDYLMQEGVTEDDASQMRIVDSGWIGTVQRSLNRLISGGEETKLEGYYFGLYSVPKGVDKSTYHSFYIAPESGLNNLLKKVNFSICLFESICSSPSSMTYGYEYSDGKVIPIRGEAGNPNKEFICRAEKYLTDFSKALALELTDTDLDISALKKMCNRLLKTCMSNPTMEESEALGKLYYSDEVLESGLDRLASRWNADDLKANRFIHKMLIKSGLKKGTLPISAWPEGSIASASDGIKKKFGLMSEKSSKTVTEIRKTVIT